MILSLKASLVLSLALIATPTLAQLPFISVWKSDNPGVSAGTQIQIPATGSGYAYSVQWSEVGNPNNSGFLSAQTGTAVLTFPNTGTYQVEIQGDFPRIYFNNTGDRLKLLEIVQWGDIQWQSMQGAFYGCENLMMGSNAGIPDLSNVTSMADMFRGCSSFNGVVGEWDVSNVTNMSGLFRGCSVFNQDLDSWNVNNVGNMADMFRDASSFNKTLGSWDVSNVVSMARMFLNAASFNNGENPGLSGGPWEWNTSSVTDMVGMFSGAFSFNQNIIGWNTASVTNMGSVFSGASVFNQNIGGWNVGNATNMLDMFRNATAFNGDISGWNVGSVQFFSNMFEGATSFNQNIGGWNTLNAINMLRMFAGASSFNQNIGNWSMGGVTNATGMFEGAGLATCKYDSLLLGWSQQTLLNGLSFSAGTSRYTSGSDAASARNLIITNFQWAISDGGTVAPLNPSVSPAGQVQLCEGSSLTLTASAGASFQWAITGDNAQTISVSEPGFYTVTITYADGCSATSVATQIVGITVPTVPAAIFGSASACQGIDNQYSIDPVAGATSYVWTVPFGWTGSSTGTSITTVAAQVGGQVTVAAVSSCGTGPAQVINVNSFPANFQLSGDVRLLGTPVNSGWVYTYRVENGSSYIRADSAQIVGGQYNFGNLDLYPVPFIIRAMPDLSLYPLAVPTYFAQNGMSFQWDDPNLDYELITQCGANDQRDFDLVVAEFTPGSGNSILSGTVYWGPAPGSGKVEAEDPIPGVDVVVEKVPPGSAFAFDVTDNAGRYVFEDVPVIPQVGSVYQIYVSIPGTPMADTYYIEIVNDGTEYDNLDFVVDVETNMIYPVGWPYVSVEHVENSEELIIQPNPMEDRMTVVLPTRFGTAIGYRVIGTDGRTHVEEMLRTDTRFDVMRNNLPPGLYIIQVMNGEGAVVLARMIVR